MPSFSVTVNHALTREEAVARLRDYSARLETEYGEHVSQIQKAWDDHGNMNFKFKAMGFSINGDMIAGDSQVTIRGSLPFLAVPLRGMIEQQVAQRLRDALQEA